MTTSVTESFHSSISRTLTPEEQAQILYIKALELGDITEAAVQIQDIITYLNNAIALNPNHAGAYIARAILITHSENTLKEHDENRKLALIDLTRAIELNPDYSDDYFDRGTAQFYRGYLRFLNISETALNGGTPSLEEIELAEADFEFGLDLDMLEQLAAIKDHFYT
jgi:tetratricopeptide (TPR) repeat protein